MCLHKIYVIVTRFAKLCNIFCRTQLQTANASRLTWYTLKVRSTSRNVIFANPVVYMVYSALRKNTLCLLEIQYLLRQQMHQDTCYTCTTSLVEILIHLQEVYKLAFGYMPLPITSYFVGCTVSVWFSKALWYRIHHVEHFGAKCYIVSTPPWSVLKFP